MTIIDRLYARGFMNKSVAEISKEEKIYFRQVLYTLIVSLLIHQTSASVYFRRLLKYKIYSELTYNTLDPLLAVIMNAFLFILRLALRNSNTCLSSDFSFY